MFLYIPELVIDCGIHACMVLTIPYDPALGTFTSILKLGTCTRMGVFSPLVVAVLVHAKTSLLRRWDVQ